MYLSEVIEVTVAAETFRHPQNAGNLQVNLANADFGIISAAAPPRNVQLWIRLQF